VKVSPDPTWGYLWREEGREGRGGAGRGGEGRGGGGERRGGEGREGEESGGVRNGRTSTGLWLPVIAEATIYSKHEPPPLALPR
jgi:hypothetical protein